MTPHESRGFEMRLAQAPAGTPVTVEIVLQGNADVGRLWLRLNTTPPDRPEARPEPDADAAFMRAVFTAPAESLRDGPNKLALRVDGYNKHKTPLDVISIEVRVGASAP